MICHGHSDSIAVVAVAAAAVEEIILPILLHEPLSLDDTVLPRLVIPHEVNGLANDTHACRVEQRCPKLSLVSVSITIYFVHDIVACSVFQDCRIDDSL